MTAMLVFAFGACIGSFLNVLIWRLPKEQSISKGRSRCPNCNTQLSWYNLLPIISFVWQNGRCHHCRKLISVRYPTIEVICASLFLLAWYLIEPTDLYSWLLLLRDWFIISVLIVVFVIDLEHYLILDKVVLPSAVILLLGGIGFDVWLGSAWQSSITTSSILGAVIGFLPFFLLWSVSRGRWIGLGDAKFGIFLGTTFGFPLILLSYFLAFLLGGLVAIPLLLLGKKQLGSKLPFGTFLAVSALVVLWFGQDILRWYLDLVGISWPS